MTARTWLIRVAQLGLCIALLRVDWAQADVVIGFDDRPAFTLITSQYHDQGVDFAGPLYVNAGEPGEAQSPPNVLNLEGCGVEVCPPSQNLHGTFTTTRQRVRMYVGNLEPATPVTVTLYAYDINDDVIAQSPPQTLVAAGVHASIEVIAPVPQIAKFELRRDDVRHDVGIDDVNFDAPTEVKPDFSVSITGYFPGVAVVDRGASAHPVTLLIHRINGSAGNIGFSVDTGTLPTGVTASFNPNPTAGADGSTVELTFSASDSAPSTTAVPVTVIATPTPSAGAAARSIAVPVEVTFTYDMQVNGIEVTQGIQTRYLPPLELKPKDYANPAAPVSYSGVKLVARAKTVARVYANLHISPPGGLPGVGMQLRGFRSGQELPGSPLQGGVRTLSLGGPDVRSDQRLNGPSWDFALPAAWTKLEGPISLTAEVVPPAGGLVGFGPSLEECDSQSCRDNNVFTLSGIKFTVMRTVHVAPILMHVEDEQILPTGIVFEEVRNVAPLGEGQFALGEYLTVIDITDLDECNCYRIAIPFPTCLQEVTCTGTGTPVTNGDDIKNKLVANRLKHFLEDEDIGGIRVGVNNGVARGLSLPVWPPITVVDTHRPFTSVAHELFHAMGRVHASGCSGGNSNGQVGEDWPPDQQGYIEGIGYDRRTRQVIAPGVPAGIPQWFDFMSYCSPFEACGDPNSDDALNCTNQGTWVSDRGWNATIDWLSNPFLLPLGRTTLDALAPPARPHPRVSPRGAGDSQIRASAFLLTSGPRDPTVTVVLTDVQPGTAAPVSGDPSSYQLVVRNAAGDVAGQGTMLLTEGHSRSGPVIFLTAQVEAPGAVRVEIVQGGAVVAARDRSPSTPSITIRSPRRGARIGQRRTTPVRWEAVDADQDPLMVKLEYSADDGQTWRGIFAGPNTDAATLPSAVFSRSRRARLRLRVNDGFNESTVVSDRFVAVGTRPTVRINSPTEGEELASEEALYLSGEAVDDTGNHLDGEQLRWYVGRKRLGNGQSLSVANLPPGKRRIRLAARDGAGRVGRATVRVHVLRGETKRKKKLIIIGE